MRNEIVNNSKNDSKFVFCVFVLNAIALLGCWLPLSALAKTPTDAGVLQQQIERDKLPALPLRPLRPSAAADAAPDIAWLSL